MKIVKMAGGARRQEESGFTFSDKKVQGASVGRKGDELYIISPRRFKLYTEGTETVHVLSGSGYIKWKRGEIPFAEGDAVLAEAPGEYEVNGACTFIVTKAPQDLG